MKTIIIEEIFNLIETPNCGNYIEGSSFIKEWLNNNDNPLNKYMEDRKSVV